MTTIDLGLTHPAANSLRSRAQLLSDRTDRRPLRTRMLFRLEHHPHRAFTQLDWIPPPTSGLRLCHDSILSRTGACNIPGAVQSESASRVGPRVLKPIELTGFKTLGPT